MLRVRVRLRYLAITGVALVTALAPLLATGAPATAGTARAGTAQAWTGQARTVRVRSFDGTEIVTHFFPAEGLAPGQRAATVLDGPGWGSPGETDPDGGSVGPLRAHGYNVVTWDPRGFGHSGGRAEVDFAPYEGRDMSVLIDWIARQPEVRLDRPGDPRLGMVGGSYGGGIQLVTAGLDHRVDAIVPTIAWHSLLHSLDPHRVYKSGWDGLLCLAGSVNHVDPHVTSGCLTGGTEGIMTPAVRRWFAAHDMSHLVAHITAPTMIVQGTVDTLFPLAQGVANYRILRRHHVPVKLVWYCGGHGTCRTNPGIAGHTQALTLAWLDRYLRGAHVSTGPGFEYVDDTGTWRGAHSYPLPAPGDRDRDHHHRGRSRDPDGPGHGGHGHGRHEDHDHDGRHGRAASHGAGLYGAGLHGVGLHRATLHGVGRGTLHFSPADTSGTTTYAQPAANAVGVHVAMPRRASEAVGAPVLHLRYRGTASLPVTPVYAQLVDERTGLVVGNQATPIRLRLDGRTHHATVRLATIAWRARPTGRLTLQLTPATRLFDRQRATGTVHLAARVHIPLADPGHVIAPAP